MIIKKLAFPIIAIVLMVYAYKYFYILYPRLICLTGEVQPATIKIENNYFNFSEKIDLKNYIFGKYKVRNDDIKIFYPGIAIKLYFIDNINRWAYLKIKNISFVKKYLYLWINNYPIYISDVYFNNIARVYIPASFQRQGLNYLYLILSDEKESLSLSSLLIKKNSIYPKNNWEKKNKGSHFSFHQQNQTIWISGEGEINYYIKIPDNCYLEYYLNYKIDSEIHRKQSLNLDIKLEREGFSKIFHHNFLIESSQESQWRKYVRRLDGFNNRIAKLRIGIKKDKEEDIGKIIIGLKIWLRGRDTSNKEKAILDRKDLNVILIVLDAASASHFSCYGYPVKTTPNIDEFSKKSLLFTNAYTTAVFTRGSTASLFTSLYPTSHKIVNLLYKLPQAAKTLAEIFQQNGYETIMFTANGNASKQTGLAQGFNEYYELFGAKAEKVSEKIIKRLEKYQKGRFFLYAHYREPHAPFDAPYEIRNKFNKSGLPTLENNTDLITKIYDGTISPDQKQLNYFISQYDANLNYSDAAVGKLLSFILNSKLKENTIIIITSDHGEAMGKHNGVFGHMWNLNRETIWIPLIIYSPHNKKKKNVDALVENIDIMPTLIELLQLKNAPALMQGNSFAYCWTNKYCKEKEEEVYSESVSQRFYSMLNKNYHMIYDKYYNNWQLFQIEDDSQERYNVVNKYPIISNYFRYKLLKYLTINNSLSLTIYRSWNQEKFEPSKEVIENLKALGYID